MIISELISRDTALLELQKPAYEPELLKQDMEFVLKKFGLTRAEWNEIMARPKVEAREYPSNYLLFHSMTKYKNVFRKIATTP